MNRRHFLAASVAAGFAPAFGQDAGRPGKKLLLVSSWQVENIGDIAHTPGMLALLEKHRPADSVTLWPKRVSPEVVKMLEARFPQLTIAQTEAEQEAALQECDFVIHGSGPGMVGHRVLRKARAAGKPYGFFGITLSDEELTNEAGRTLLANAEYVFNRDTDSLKAFRQAGIEGPKSDFGPDATFAVDLRDDKAADRLLAKYGLEAGGYLCAVPRLRRTPYWEIRPQESKPNPRFIEENRKFAEIDHAKVRAGISAWVRETGMKVFLVPEMTYQTALLKPLLFDPLPDDVKPSVAMIDRYWLTDEAASVYAKAAAIVSIEQHSPILAIAAGVPAVHLRQPTDSRKGQMWRDIGLNDWLFEIDDTAGEQVARKLVEIGKDLPAARTIAAKARQFAHERMAAMVQAIG